MFDNRDHGVALRGRPFAHENATVCWADNDAGAVVEERRRRFERASHD